MKRLINTIASLTLFTTAVTADELKLADFQPPTHFIVGSVYAPFSEAISEATDGDVTVRLFMGGNLGQAQQSNTTVLSTALLTSRLASPVIPHLHFQQHCLLNCPALSRLTQEPKKYLPTLICCRTNTVLLGLWNNAPNLLLMADKRVDSIDDLQGLAIRVPSRNAGLIALAWGANPVSMPAPAIYNAMQTGVLDGAMIDATTLKAFRLAEVTSSVTMGMDTTISQFFLIMNRDSFADLNEEQQEAIISAGRNASMTANAAWLSVAQGTLADFAATEGKEVIVLSDQSAADFNEVSRITVEQIVADSDGANYVNALRGE